MKCKDCVYCDKSCCTNAIGMSIYLPDELLEMEICPLGVKEVGINDLL